LFKKYSIIIFVCVTDLLLHNQNAHTYTHTHTHIHAQLVYLTKDETSWQAADKGWVILTSKRTDKDQQADTTHTHRHTHTDTHIHTHTQTHTYTHTHIHAQLVHLTKDETSW